MEKLVFTYLFLRRSRQTNRSRQGFHMEKDPEGRIVLQERSDPNHQYGPYAPLVESTAQEELGNIQPDLTGGFSTSLRYKDFHLGMSFDFQVGGVIASATNMFGESSGLLASTTGTNDKGNPIRAQVKDGGGVRIDGVVENQDGSYTPVTAYVDASYYFQSRKGTIWEDYVYKASYLKMRELSIGYDIPRSFLQKRIVVLKSQRIICRPKSLVNLFRSSQPRPVGNGCSKL